MLRYMMVYGALSGAVIIAIMLANFTINDFEIDASPRAMIIGYLIMLTALSLVFVGIKRYRDKELGGVINFGHAFGLGIGMAAVAGVAYVLIFEIYLVATDHAFIDKYTESMIEMQREKGASQEALQKTIDHTDQLKAVYANPLSRMGMTFLELFPLAAIVSLVSALLLRNEKFLPARK